MSNIDPTAMFKISYGLYVVTANRDGKQNGCVINTVNQLTSDPVRLCITVNKQNYTNEMITATGMFNLSVLTEEVNFDVIKRFGFSSGRDTDKFDGFADIATADNGIVYLTKYSNALISCKVIDTYDCGTHTMFIADVVETKILSDAPSVTYDYYFKHIKPAPAPQKKKGYVCKICGFVYEGDELPEDYVCPLCKHPASDFEPLE